MRRRDNRSRGAVCAVLAATVDQDVPDGDGFRSGTALAIDTYSLPKSLSAAQDSLHWAMSVSESSK